MSDLGVSEALLISAAVSVATTAATAYTQYQGQKQQAEMQQQFNDKQTQNFNDARVAMYNQGAQQEQYTNQAEWEKLYQNTQANRAAEATAMTSAGEANITGTSVQALAASYDEQRGQTGSDLEFNRAADTNQIQQQLTGYNINTQGNINSLRPSVQPSWINPALQVAGGAAQAYTGYRSGLNGSTRQNSRISEGADAVA